MNNDTDDEVRFADILDVLRRQKRVLLAAPVVLLALALVYLHIAAPVYAVTLQVTPTASAVSTLPAGLSGLADLTGLALPGGNENIDFELYLEGLTSRETCAAVTSHADLMRRLFPDDWDADSGQWREPGGLFARLAAIGKAIVGVPGRAWRAPDADRVSEFLDEELKVVRDRSGPVVTILIEHERPAVAQDLLSVLHEIVDAALRAKELDRTGAYVAYLREQLANVAVTEYRQALHDILAEQEKRRMVASSNLPFAAEPFSGPTVSVQPVSPRPFLTLASSLLFGVLLGVMLALLRHEAGRRRPASG